MPIRSGIRSFNAILFVLAILPLLSSAQSVKEIDATNDDSLAMAMVERALAVATDKKTRLELNLRLAMRANRLQQFEKALAVANEALMQAKAAKYDSLEAAIGKNIGVTYYYMDQKRAAVPYFENAARIAQQKGFWELEASCLNNLGAAWADVQEYERAEPQLLRSIAIMESHGMADATVTLRTDRVLARVYSQHSEPEKAEAIYLKLIAASELNKDSALLSDNLMFYSDLLRERKAFTKAVEMGQSALAIIRVLPDRQSLRMALDIQSLNLSAAGRDREAYELSRESHYLMRSNFTEELANRVGELEVKHKTAQLKYEKELAELENRKQRQIYLFSFFGVLLILGSAAFIFTQRRTAKLKAARIMEMAEMEKQRFEQVLEAEENERKRIAQELHDGVGQTLALARLNVSMLDSEPADNERDRIKTSLSILDAACNEVRHISHNMMPGALIHAGLVSALHDLFDNVNAAQTINIRFSASDDLELAEKWEVTIYRIVQEILSNTLKHAQASELEVSIINHKEAVLIRTKDNGKGFDTDRMQDSEGIGWKNIRSRVAMCNGRLVVNSSIGKGVEILIHIPQT